jgi:beta-hydroxylase
MGLYILGIFIICSIYVQNRGKVPHTTLKRKITDHSNLLSPINCLFYMTSRIKNTPYIDMKNFPELQVLIDNWQIIRDDAMRLHEASQIKASDNKNDLGFNSFFKTGWKRFYLKWYGSDLKSATRLCPTTVDMLKKIPSVKGAMFAMLPPGATLVRHRDPYAGSYRFHMGLMTPNSEDCYISVDGENYFWKDGEAVLFDETYIHYAANNTDQDRTILFLDVKRPVKYKIVDWINAGFSRIVIAASATKNMDGDKVGFLNRIFPALMSIRVVGKRLKAYNQTLYYVVQYGIYLGLIYLIFF